MKSSKKKTILIYVLVGVAFLAVIWIMTSMYRSSTMPTYRYSDIVYLFEDQKVQSYTLDFGSGEFTAQLVEGADDGQGHNEIQSYNVPSASVFLEDIQDAVNQYNTDHPDNRMQIDYSYSSSNSWIISLIPSLLILACMIFLFVYMARQTSSGKLSQFGRSNMKNPVNNVKTRFSDVAGADEEKEELAEVVEFLKNPRKFNELGARIPKGVLLVGPPGTGKTLLARAVAGEAGVPFFSISGSDFVEMFVGVGASRVRELFDQAKKNAPAIIFIDEIDAVGRQRGAGLGGGHDEREQTLNQLLVEMDGFGVNQGIIIIAATNRRDILDPALLRPGRFDRQVVVGYPDVKGREEILKVHAKNKPLGFDVDLKVIARSTAGFTGADLENLLNEAALLAARRGRKAITGVDIEEATIKVVAGPEKKSRKMTLSDKKITAYHEAGHAITSYYLETADPVHEISIIPRGMAAGYTMNLPEDDRSHMSRKKMTESLVMLLGGRAAEALTLDDICTGASNDIERATETARQMVTKYGFSDELGTVTYGKDTGEVFLGRDLGHERNYSEEVANQIDRAIRKLIDNAYAKATDILTQHRYQLELVAKYLMIHEKVDSVQFKDLMNGGVEMAPLDQELTQMEQDEAAKKAKVREEMAQVEQERAKIHAAERKEREASRTQPAKSEPAPQPSDGNPSEEDQGE